MAFKFRFDGDSTDFDRLIGLTERTQVAALRAALEQAQQSQALIDQSASAQIAQRILAPSATINQGLPQGAIPYAAQPTAQPQPMAPPAYFNNPPIDPGLLARPIQPVQHQPVSPMPRTMPRSTVRPSTNPFPSQTFSPTRQSGWTINQFFSQVFSGKNLQDLQSLFLALLFLSTMAAGFRHASTIQGWLRSLLRPPAATAPAPAPPKPSEPSPAPEAPPAEPAPEAPPAEPAEPAPEAPPESLSDKARKILEEPIAP